MPAERIGRFAALRHRDFALLWSGNVVSRLGSQMRDVATAWQVYVLTHSALALGMIAAFRAVPMLVLALGGGLAADSLDRKRILLVTQTILAVTSALMAILTAQGAMTTGLLYGFTAVIAATNAFDAPARQTVVTNILPEEDLPNGLTLGVLGLEVSTVVGPAVGGIMLAATSIQAIYVVDAITYAAVLAALFVIRPRPRAVAEVTGKGAVSNGIGAIAEAVRFLRSKPILIWLMMADFVATFFAGSLLLLPIFADQIFMVGPRGLGWLRSAPSAGALIASMWLSWRPPIERYGLVVLGSVLVYGASVAGFGLVRSFPLALLLLAGSGAADTVSTVVRQVVRQTFTPDELRGRMTGINMIFFVGGPQLGEVEAGVVASLTSVGFSVVSGGVACMIAAVLGTAFVPALRNLRRGGGEHHAAPPRAG